jgi:hypothetical protein
MNWLKAIGYGIALFAILFVIGSIAMFGLKVTGNTMSIIMLIAAIIVVWLLAKQYKIGSLNAGIRVGLVWLVVDALLEYLVIIQIFNKGVVGGFYNWSVILGYALIVVIPALVGQLKKT